MTPNQLEYLPLVKIAEALDMPITSLRIRLCTARKLGIALPESRRIGRKIFFRTADFLQWLWTHGENLNRKFSTAEHESK